MCRYAYCGYRTSFVCLSCRHVAQYHDGEHPCPKCRKLMINAGRDFQAPRKRNDGEWRAVEEILRSGKDYDSCGCTGPGYRPRTFAQLKQDLLPAKLTRKVRRKA